MGDVMIWFHTILPKKAAMPVLCGDGGCFGEAAPLLVEVCPHRLGRIFPVDGKPTAEATTGMNFT